MKPAPFAWWSPTTLPEALAMLTDKPNARPLAGGQSLMPMLNMRLAAPDHLIDLNRVAGLAGVSEQGGDIVFGGMTRQRDIEFSELVAERLPLIAEAIRSVGHRQTRNRGTFGGSLCHLDPSAELPTVAMAMDATLKIESRRGSRMLPMAEFPAGYMTPAIEADELLTEIRIRPWARGHGYAFIEFARRHGDFAVVSAAALIEPDGDGRIRRASLTLGGVGPAPLRMAASEALLHGARADAARLDEAAELCAGIEALEDPVYPAWYRQKLARTLSRRALEQACGRAGLMNPAKKEGA
jgi:carbon-monoxide dehydrogenase medium subunit